MTLSKDILSKDILREEFSRDYSKYYSAKLFSENGFVRKRCIKCGKYFWTADPDRELCGDPEHEPYSFIRDNGNEISYADLWKRFSDFFKSNGHEEIEKYPVVSRWRPDLYFTIASIQDFQRIEKGRMDFEYPANPLIVPQICIRFNDIENTGITGRHLTSFMMAGQHAFNYPKEGYWIDRTIELNFRFLTEVMKIKKKDITYIEDVWAMGDFSEFGPCLEAFANGLELVNNVFTQFTYANGKRNELEGKVVDVGWGFERLMWYYTGKPTLYDAVFKRELDYLYKHTGIKNEMELYKKIAGISSYIDIDEKFNDRYDKVLIEKSGISANDYYKKVKPMQAAYAIVDHLRTLLFAINDGALPSNVGGGYNLRVLIRRIYALMEEYGMDFDLMAVIELLIQELQPLYKDIGSSTEEIKKVFDIERERYNAAKSSAAAIVKSLLEKNEKIDAKKLKLLYESNGISPDYIAEQARKKGIELDIPENFYLNVIKGDFSERKKGSEAEEDVSGIGKTEKLYYNFETRSISKVLKAYGNVAILDKSPFYPEGGGQEADHGTINGIYVKDVQIIGDVIVHKLAEPCNFSNGDMVECIVDEKRRNRLMAHHTATHLISAAARAVLGRHAWQEGAKKGYEKAHIDIAHYERLSESEIKEIEAKANSYILNGIKVTATEMDRKDAEERFGFTIYQGHGAPLKKLRIVEIRDLEGNLIDAEACGGLHLVGREGSLGIIKIINSYRIHDGIDRIEFAAGEAALDYIKEMEGRLKAAAEALNSDEEHLQERAKLQAEELKALKKQASSIFEELGKNMDADANAKMLPYARESLRIIADAYAKKNGSILLLYNKSNDVVCISACERSALDFANDFARSMKKRFVGGGSARIAEGRLE